MQASPPGAAAADAEHLLRQQEVTQVEPEGHVLREVELEADARLPGQALDGVAERAPGAGYGEDVAVDDGRVGELELRVDGRPEQREDPLPGGRRLKVMLEIEGGERLLEPEAKRRAGDEHLEPEVLRRVERERPAVVVGRRQHVGGVEAADRRDLEAMALEEVAPLDPLAPAAGGVPLEAGQAVERRLGLSLPLAFGFLTLALFLSRLARRRLRRLRRLLVRGRGLLVCALRKRVLGWSGARRGRGSGLVPVGEAYGQGEDDRRANQRSKIVALAHCAWQGSSCVFFSPPVRKLSQKSPSRNARTSLEVAQPCCVM